MILDDLGCAVDEMSAPVKLTRYKPALVVKGRKLGDDEESTIEVMAQVSPATARDLKRLPEGMRTDGAVRIISTTKMHTAEVSECKRPDVMTSNGIRYSIRTVHDWYQLGGFYEMFGEQLSR